MNDADSDQLRIWIDADACPNAIKEIVFRAAERAKIETVLVATHAARTPASPFLRSVQVAPGWDAADKRILELMRAGDLVITADVPFAAAVVERGGQALNPRGELYTTENVREHLSMRNFMQELRGGGLAAGGPPPLSAREKQTFANRLDALLARRKR